MSQRVSELLSSNNLWRVLNNAHVFDLLCCQWHQFRILLQLIADLALQISITRLPPCESLVIKHGNVILLILLFILCPLAGRLVKSGSLDFSLEFAWIADPFLEQSDQSSIAILVSNESFRSSFYTLLVQSLLIETPDVCPILRVHPENCLHGEDRLRYDFHY